MRYFNVKHNSKRHNLFQSFASIGRVDLVFQSLFTFLQTALFSIVNTKYLELKIRGKVKFKCIYFHLQVTVKCSDVMLVSSGIVIFEAVTV